MYLYNYKIFNIINFSHRSIDKGDALTGKSEIKKNFFYNISYQILTLILPLITEPYVSRCLGADLLGLYSKTHALANYFYLFTLLGVNNYGNRAIARVRNDGLQTSRTFWEIYTFQCLISVAVFVAYVLFCLIIEQENRQIYILQAFYVLSGMFEVNWFCYGMEKFRLTTVCSTIVRLAVTAAVFLFVHDQADIGVYTVILSLSFLLSCLAVWPFVLKTVSFVKPAWVGIKRHIKPNLLLFWPVIAVSLYNIMDKVMLGWFSENSEVAFYSCAEKIVTIPVTIILALDNVVMPRMSYIFANQDEQRVRELMSSVMLFAMFVSSAMMFGLAAIAEKFAPWFYGTAFTRCGWFIVLLTPTILFKGWAGALRTQFIIPTGRDTIYIISLTSGALINLILNILLIPLWNGVGAIIGTIAAEFAVAFIQFFLCRREIPIGEYLRDGISLVFVGGIMYACIRPISRLEFSTPIILCTQIVIGIIVYSVLGCIYMVKIAKQPILFYEVLKTLHIKRKL